MSRLRHTDGKRIRNAGERVRCADTSGCCGVEIMCGDTSVVHPSDVEVTVSAFVNDSCGACTEFNTSFVLSYASSTTICLNQDEGATDCWWHGLFTLAASCSWPYSSSVEFAIWDNGMTYFAECSVADGISDGGTIYWRKSQVTPFTQPIEFTSSDLYTGNACSGDGITSIGDCDASSAVASVSYA